MGHGPCACGLRSGAAAGTILTTSSAVPAMTTGSRTSGRITIGPRPYPEREIKKAMRELMGAFGISEAAGQAQWKKTREAVLRRRREAERAEKAEQAEAALVKKLPGPRHSKYVKRAVEQRYGADS